MKKAIIRNPDILKGKTKEEVLSLLGDHYESEYGGDMWVYFFKKMWFTRKEKAIIIAFDHDGIVEEAKKININF